MGTRDADALARACDLGVAMQLSNIARDVGEDARRRPALPAARVAARRGARPRRVARRGRRTTPRSHRSSRGCSTRPTVSIAASAPASRGCRWTCRPGINAARRLYAEIGREVARRDHDAIAGRAVVPPWRKAFVLATAVAAVPLLRGRPPRRREPPLHATAFLVDAAVDRAPPSPSGVVGACHLDDRAVRAPRASRRRPRVVVAGRRGRALIWLEVLLGFVIPVGFGAWQLLDLRRERRLDAAKAAAEAASTGTDRPRPVAASR